MSQYQNFDENHFWELWSDFLEGELDDTGLAELQHRITSDEHLLKMAADSFELHRLLGLNAAEEPEQRESFIRQTMSLLPQERQGFVQSVMRGIQPAAEERAGSSPVRQRRKMWQAVSLALLTVAGGIGLMFLLWPKSTNIAKITGLSGSVLWTGDGGLVDHNLALGSRLGGGTLEGLGPNAWVELTFDDQSKVTLSGKGLLTFSAQERKQLYLREGNMTADIAPQPDGKALLIHTRSAELEVLGTRFSVEAEMASTTLNVNHGSVRVRRLTDGQQVDVPAQHLLVTSAETQLVPEKVPDFTDRWQSNLALGPIDTLGNWVPATAQSAARLRAIPFVYKPPGSGTEERSMTLYLAALPVSQGDKQPVVLRSESEFRIVGSLKAPCQLYFGFQVHRTDGQFAGKFLAEQAIPADSSDDLERFEIVLPIGDFQLDPSLANLKDRLPASPVGLVVSGCWCFTLTSQDLELQQVSLTPAP